MSFKPFGKGNPCPVCNLESSACRSHRNDSNYIHCHTHADAKKFEIIGNWKCIEVARGHTAGFRPDDSHLSEQAKREQKTRWLQEQQLREQKRKRKQQEQKAKALSIEQRHELYSQIREELINSGLRFDLRKSRNLSETENQVVEVFKVRKYHQLSKKYDSRLPGLNQFNKSQVGNSGDGLIGFIRNADGLISGYQVRLENAPDGGRYRWGSSGDTPVHTKEHGELPLAVYVPSNFYSLDIQLVEGTMIKPQIAAERNGMVTIGASGCNFLSSPETLKSIIKEIHEKILIPRGANKNSIRFTIAPDAGFAENKQVCSKLVDLYLWIQENYSEYIYFFDWNQICKSQGDIDEVQDLSIIRHLSLEDFRVKYREALQSCRYPGSRFQNYLKNRKHLIPDIVQREKHVSIPPNAPELCDILLIQRDMGGGKTEAMLNHALLNKQWSSIVESYRNSLSHGTVKRAIKKGLKASHVADMQESVEGINVNYARDGNLDLIAGCLDSYQKMEVFTQFNPDYQVIIDEVDSVLDHLRQGGTLSHRQQKAIEFFKKSINDAQFTLMMDANLNQKIVELIKALFPDKKILVLKSEPIVKPKAKKFYFLETESDKGDFSRNHKYLPDHLVKIAKDYLVKGKKVLWISDSQKACEVIDELVTKEIKGSKVFRFDGKTSQDKVSKDFKENPVEFILQSMIDLLAISPSGESGLDLSIFDYFDVVCFDIRGVLGVNKLVQQSGRLRDVLPPIYVACPEFSNMTENLCPFALNQVKDVLSQKLEMLIAKSMEVDSALIDSDFIKNTFTEMGEVFSKDELFKSALEESKLLKYEHSNLKLCLKSALAQDGHIIIDSVESRDVEAEAERKEYKELVKQREAEQIFNAEDIDHEKAKELAKKEVDWHTKCKVTKANFKHSLPGIQDTESWSIDLIRAAVVDNSKFVSQRWRLKQFENEELFKSVFKKQKSFNFENGFSPKDIWKSDSTKIESIKLMGFGEILQKGIFSCREDWVRKIIDRYYDDEQFYNLIGITRAKRDEKGMYVKKTIERFLEYFGLECGKAKKNSNGNRFYPIVPNKSVTPYLLDIDACLERRTEATIHEAKEISLSNAARSAEVEAEANKQWNEKHSQILAKRILEEQLSIEWQQEERITGIVEMLLSCENEGMTKDVYALDIPDAVFQLAEMQLSKEKQSQLMFWRFNSTNEPRHLSPPLYKSQTERCRYPSHLENQTNEVIVVEGHGNTYVPRHLSPPLYKSQTERCR